MKKSLSFFVSVLMILSLFSLNVSASSPTEDYNMNDVIEDRMAAYTNDEILIECQGNAHIRTVYADYSTTYRITGRSYYTQEDYVNNKTKYILKLTNESYGYTYIPYVYGGYTETYSTYLQGGCPIQ